MFHNVNVSVWSIFIHHLIAYLKGNALLHLNLISPTIHLCAFMILDEGNFVVQFAETRIHKNQNMMILCSKASSNTTGTNPPSLEST